MGNADDEDIYSFAEESIPQPKPRLARGVPVRSISAREAGAPLDYARSPVTTSHDPDFGNRVRDFYLPAFLIGGGTLIYFARFWLVSRSAAGVHHAAVEFARDVVVSTLLAMLALWIVAWVRQIDFGKWNLAAFKLVAVMITPGAVTILLGPLLRFIPFGGLVLDFVLFFALLGAMFDLDQSDTWYCLCVIFIVNVAVTLGAMWL